MMRISRRNILKYANKYDDRYKNTTGEKIEIVMKCLLKKQRFLKRIDLEKIGMWKSRRPEKHYKSNNDLTVREVTAFSFNTKSEKARIESLRILKGVSYPVASAILHFAFPNKYPIMDFRVIWSLGWEQPSNYDFDFWQRYCEKIRDIAKILNLPIRTAEKALWEYSKEYQHPR
jgi:hypothetical protein